MSQGEFCRFSFRGSTASASHLTCRLARSLAGGTPQSQLICCGCGTLLFFPPVRTAAQTSSFRAATRPLG